MSARPRVAVVGSGISGLTTAYLLRRTHDVVVYEQDTRLGGHSHTHAVSLPGGGTASVDSGFIVHNHRTYPHLLRLFAELEVPTQPTEMSMSIRCHGCGLEYAGGRGAAAILAQPRNLLRPRFVRMLGEITRFHRRAARWLAAGGDETTTYGRWLDDAGFDDHFVAHFALPLVACVWSAGHDNALDYPARYLFTFLDHHGMLRVTGSPRWYTVVGGSARYVERLAAHLDDVRTGEPVHRVERTTEGVDVVSGADGRTRESYDHVVLATHGPTSLRLLASPTPLEEEVLRAFSCTENPTTLHRDPSRLPRAPRARAAWNYEMTSCAARESSPTVTYWMNRLHGLDESDPVLVTLDPAIDVADEDVIARMTYEHPVYTVESVAAARRIDEICDDRVSYAGAHLGWGFHEDGCRSGVRAAERLGVTW